MLNAAGTAVDNNHSGPDGVVSHGRWLYAGDGDSTLKVIDLNAPNKSAIQQSISTGGTTRVDEMALTTDGKLLLTANNAEDPPFATLFTANGDGQFSNVAIITKITIDDAIVPEGFGLAIEQPAWDPKTERFYVSIPVIANNPAGCNFDGAVGDITCDGGLLVVDPTTPTAVLGAFDPATNTGVVPLHACGPNGATVGPHDNLLLGCTPANNPSNATTLVINATTKNFANIGNIVGSDEVWFNKGDRRYYTASNRNCKTTEHPVQTRTNRRPCSASSTAPVFSSKPFRNPPGRTRWRRTPSATLSSFRNRRLSQWSGPAVTLLTWARGFAAALTGVSVSTSMLSTRTGTITREIGTDNSVSLTQPRRK